MPPLPLSQFHEGTVTGALLDCRAEREFARGHLPGCGNIPAEDLRARRSELPPRDAPLIVVSDSGRRAAEAAETLEVLGYDAWWLDAAASEVAGGLSDHSPPVRLWQPSPFLEERLPGVPRGRALDVAAGAGRESVYLAMNGFEVESLDRAPEALRKAEQMAKRHGVEISTRVCDLEARGVQLTIGRYQLVTVFRFLHRPLMPKLEHALAPGGHLLYETYRMGQQRFGRPTHPRFLLWPDELAKAFPSLEVLHYEESDPPGGPVMARLHARRPQGRTRP